MTNDRAKSELMQIYMSLSEEKKKALDVAFKAMEQADNIPVMHYPQVDGITPTVVAQADGEYILKKDVMGCIGQTSVHSELARKLRKLPSVAIPPDHDGCKDCKYETYPEYYYPCCECKQNYTDEWQKKGARNNVEKKETDGKVHRPLMVKLLSSKLIITTCGKFYKRERSEE